MTFALISRKYLYPSDNIIYMAKAEIYFDQSKLLHDVKYCKDNDSLIKSIVLISFDDNKLYKWNNSSYTYCINANDIEIVDFDKFEILMSLI